MAEAGTASVAPGTETAAAGVVAVGIGVFVGTGTVVWVGAAGVVVGMVVTAVEV